MIQEHNGILYVVLELKKNECQSIKESQKSFNQFRILVLLINALPYILMLQYYDLNSEPGIVQRDLVLVIADLVNPYTGLDREHDTNQPKL